MNPKPTTQPAPTRSRSAPTTYPDLAIVDFRVASNAPAVGQSVDIVVAVQNQGTDPFNGPLQPGVGLYLDVLPTDCATQVVLPDWGKPLASLDIGETAYYTFTQNIQQHPASSCMRPWTTAAWWRSRTKTTTPPGRCRW